MLTVGLSMIRNEIDIVVDTVDHMLQQVDQVWVLDNNSTDGTSEALRSINDSRLTVINDPEVAYYQSAKMTNLANNAWATNGYRDCWFVPFDGDERWEPADMDLTIADVLAEHRSMGSRIVLAKLFDYRCTGKDIQSAASPVDRMVWRCSYPAPLPKVAISWSTGCTIQQGNHGAIVPGGAQPVPCDLIVRHYPWRSVEHMVRKVTQGKVAYDATDLPFEVGQHWREYGAHYERGGKDAIGEIFNTWFYFDDPAASGLILDPARP